MHKTPENVMGTVLTWQFIRLKVLKQGLCYGISCCYVP